jgi:hypothetical protein
VRGEVEIEVGQVVDLRKILRPFGVSETRMPRRNHAKALCQFLQIGRGIRVRPLGAVQEQQVTPLPALQHLGPGAGDGDLFQAQFLRHLALSDVVLYFGYNNHIMKRSGPFGQGRPRDSPSRRALLDLQCASTPAR